jgi:hypothetical protein
MSGRADRIGFSLEMSGQSAFARLFGVVLDVSADRVHVVMAGSRLCLPGRLRLPG